MYAQKGAFVYKLYKPFLFVLVAPFNELLQVGCGWVKEPPRAKGLGKLTHPLFLGSLAFAAASAPEACLPTLHKSSSLTADRGHAK